MFGTLGMQEILLLMAVALLIFGPRKLPEIGRTLGRAMGEFRRATTDFKRTLEYEADFEERKPSKPRPAQLPSSSAPSEEATHEPSSSSVSDVSDASDESNASDDADRAAS